MFHGCAELCLKTGVSTSIAIIPFKNAYNPDGVVSTMHYCITALRVPGWIGSKSKLRKIKPHPHWRCLASFPQRRVKVDRHGSMQNPPTLHWLASKSLHLVLIIFQFHCISDQIGGRSFQRFYEITRRPVWTSYRTLVNPILSKNHMVMANLMPGSDVLDTAMTLVCLGCLTSDAKILSPSLPIICGWYRLLALYFLFFL